MVSDLASWNAKVQVMADAGCTGKPKGKQGNCVTRMYDRTGWWPLKCKSELWQKAIKQFGIKPDTVDVSELTTELGPEVRIRNAVLEAFRGGFLKSAQAMKAEYAARGTRRKSTVPNTVKGKGFCKEEDLAVVVENDRKREQKELDKVCRIVCI